MRGTARVAPYTDGIQARVHGRNTLAATLWHGGVTDVVGCRPTPSSQFEQKRATARCSRSDSSSAHAEAHKKKKHVCLLTNQLAPTTRELRLATAPWQRER